MPVDRVRGERQATVVQVAQVLKSLFGDATQQAVAKRLTDAGMPIGQTVVSAWLNHRIPNWDQLAHIEATYGVPRGWIAYKAGFVDLQGLIEHGDSPAPPVSERPPETLPELRTKVEQLEATVRELTAARLEDPQPPKPPAKRRVAARSKPAKRTSTRPTSKS